MENLIKIDDLGVPLFLETPIPRNGVWKMSEMVEFSIAMSLWPTSILQSFGILFSDTQGNFTLQVELLKYSGLNGSKGQVHQVIQASLTQKWQECISDSLWTNRSASNEKVKFKACHHLKTVKINQQYNMIEAFYIHHRKSRLSPSFQRNVFLHPKGHHRTSRCHKGFRSLQRNNQIMAQSYSGHLPSLGLHFFSFRFWKVQKKHTNWLLDGPSLIFDQDFGPDSENKIIHNTYIYICILHNISISSQIKVHLVGGFFSLCQVFGSFPSTWHWLNLLFFPHVFHFI